MIKIEIEAANALDLRKQLADLLGATEPVTIKGSDVELVLHKKPTERGLSEAIEDLKTSLDAASEEDIKEAQALYPAKTEESAPVAEETKTRKRRSKAEIAAEKAVEEAAKEAEKEEADFNAADPESDEYKANADATAADTDDDDLLGDDLTDDTEPEITIDTIRPIVKELGLSNKRKSVIALLAEFKAEKLGELKESDYPAFHAKLVKL